MIPQLKKLQGTKTSNKLDVDVFCALKAKAFCFKLNDEKVKGLMKAAKGNISFDMYLNRLNNTLTKKDIC